MYELKSTENSPSSLRTENHHSALLATNFMKTIVKIW
jgi:hypothetical protein